jgi:DNA-binding CsgD family transcriptional regulator
VHTVGEMSTRELAELRVARPLLERASELARIEDVVRRAVHGVGGFVLIEGSSGIGKSRLVAEAARLAGDEGLDVLYARGEELERDYAWGTVLRLFEGRFVGKGTEGALDPLRGRASLARPLFASDPTDPSGLPAAREFSLLHGLYWAVVNLSEQHPVLLIVDDAHWADEHSLRFLIYLVERLGDLPVALVAAIRTGDVEATSALGERLLSLAGQRSLRPAELTMAATGEFLRATGLDQVSSEFVRASWEVTRGNPFLLQELAFAVRDEPLAEGAAESGRLRDFAPQSVGRSVVARLRRFGEDALELARAAAILGELASLARVARVAELGPDQAVSAAGRLLSAQLLTSMDPVRFAHPMIRSAIANETPPARKFKQQTMAAELLRLEGAPAEEIAPLLLKVAPVGSPWARDVLHQAARSSARKGAPQTAVRYLRRALEMSAPEEVEPTLLIELGLAEASSGQTASLRHFEQALALIDDPAEEGRALYALGYTLSQYGRHVEAAEVFARGQQLFETRDPELAMRFTGAAIAATWLGFGKTRAALGSDAMTRLTEAVDEITARGPESHSERVLLAAAGGVRISQISHWGGSARAGVELARQALRGIGASLADEMAAMAANTAITVLTAAGQSVEAERAADVIIESARQRGDLLGFAHASAVRALCAHSQGRIIDAMADAKAAIEGTELGYGTLVPIPHAILAACFVERDEINLADDVLGPLAALEPPTEAGYTGWTFFHWARGKLRHQSGDARGAIEEYAECRRLTADLGIWFASAACPWRRSAALAAAAVGDLEQALRLLDEDLALSQEVGLHGEVGAILQTRAVLLDDADSGALLREAIDMLEKADMPLDLARALWSLGSWLRRRGHRVESRDPLRRAQEVAHELGAIALEARAHAELLASGARGRRISLSGIDSLTPTERRVADLIARGLTNRQVAESLFVTIGTVEWHVNHIYAKFGVTTRADFKASYGAPSEPTAEERDSSTSSPTTVRAQTPR